MVQNATNAQQDSENGQNQETKEAESQLNSATSGVDYEAEANKYKDQWLRAAAEIENIKRRSKQDIEKAASFSIESFARDLVIVLDYLYSASDAITQEAAQANEQLNAVKEGIEITKREMLNSFERNSIKRIYPKGEKFDHNTQQAVVQVESDLPADTVIDVLQAGYVIKDRLLRAAMVTVAKPKA